MVTHTLRADLAGKFQRRRPSGLSRLQFPRSNIGPRKAEIVEGTATHAGRVSVGKSVADHVD